MCLFCRDCEWMQIGRSSNNGSLNCGRNRTIKPSRDVASRQILCLARSGDADHSDRDRVRTPGGVVPSRKADISHGGEHPARLPTDADRDAAPMRNCGNRLEFGNDGHTDVTLVGGITRDRQPRLSLAAGIDRKACHF